MIRPIRPEDDARLAVILRQVMVEYGAVGEGSSSVDPEVDALSRHYGGPAAGYFVAELQGEVVGGAGFGPLPDERPTVCELRKMYLVPEARGKGLGVRLLRECLDQARAAGYAECYLETRASMLDAKRLYEAAGFTPLSAPRGATGHYACDRWYQVRL